MVLANRGLSTDSAPEDDTSTQVSEADEEKVQCEATVIRVTREFRRQALNLADSSPTTWQNPARWN